MAKKAESAEKAEKAEQKEKAEKKPKAKIGHRPVERNPQRYDWVEFKPNDLIDVIVNLANSAHTEAEIGTILRDQYGIPSAKEVIGKKISVILKEKNLQPEVPRDLLNLISKSVQLQKHMATHKKDTSAKRGYQLAVSRIRRLVAYYHKKKMIPEGWKYSQQTAALLVK